MGLIRLVFSGSRRNFEPGGDYFFHLKQASVGRPTANAAAAFARDAL
jgi:hypothetical protein